MRRPDTTEIYLQLAWKLFHGQALTTRYIVDTFGVSRATAHRYLLRLEAALPVDCEEFRGRGPWPSVRLSLKVA